MKQTCAKDVEVRPKLVQVHNCCIGIEDRAVRLPIHPRRLDAHNVFPASAQCLSQPEGKIQLCADGYVVGI